MTSTPSQRSHFDIALAKRLVDDLVVAHDAGRNINPLPQAFMGTCHCHCDLKGVYSYDSTDDERGVAEQLLRVLALFLRDPGSIDDSSFTRVLHGLLVHDRWVSLVRDHDAVFNITVAIVHLAENVVPATPEINSAFYAIADVLGHQEWPFPEHGVLTPIVLRAGKLPILEHLCEFAFGPVWWQLVDPEENAILVSLALLRMRPPLLHFYSQTCNLALPELDTPGTA